MKIKSIARSDKCVPTADIEVDSTNSYQLDNGCVTHNTISKLFGLTEGWHLPSMAWFMRWVQFRNDDPLVKTYEAAGYPVRQLTSYEGTSIVGFPTEPTLASMGLGDKLVTAGEATFDEQFDWLRLGEKYWITGTDGEDRGNQTSFTMKFYPDEFSMEEFRSSILENQPTVKCCSVMPQSELVSYEYQPEEPITKARYEDVLSNISDAVTEDIGKEHIDCDNGACPVDFNEK